MESSDHQHDLINSTESETKPEEQIAQPVVESQSVEQTDEVNHPTISEAEKIDENLEPTPEAQQEEQVNPQPNVSQTQEQNHIFDETQMVTNQENNVEATIINQETIQMDQQNTQMNQENNQINQETLVESHNSEMKDKSFNPEEDESSKIHELNQNEVQNYEILPPPPPAPINDMIRMDESRDSHQSEAIESSNEDNDDNDAVNAVLAAVEQANAEKATTSTADQLNSSIAKVVKKKPKTATPNKNFTNENLSASPSSAQKRRKKDPLAPKAPLNGYLVYFNEERADMRQKNPTMSFGELTKIIALKWKDLAAEEKQKYINEAELDKERYVREMADYKKSDSYKQYLKETSNAKMARNEEAIHFANIKKESLDNSYSPNQQGGININSLQHEVNVAGFDIPIFTEEFIEHSKNREHEMRQIRKEINELEQQNNVLHKHIDNMKQSTAKVESDIDKYSVTNDKISKNLDIFRQTILNCFGNLPLPNSQEYPSPTNIDEYIMKLYSVLANNSMNQQDNHAFKMHVKSTLSKINFNSLFD